MRERLQWAERGAGEPRERQRHTAAPRFFAAPVPAPLVCPLPPLPRLSIPSEVTTDCLSRRRSAPQGGWLRHPLRGYVNLLREGKER